MLDCKTGPNTVRLTVRPEPVEGSGRTRTGLRPFDRLRTGQAQHERIWHLTEQYCVLTPTPARHAKVGVRSSSSAPYPRARTHLRASFFAWNPPRLCGFRRGGLRVSARQQARNSFHLPGSGWCCDAPVNALFNQKGQANFETNQLQFTETEAGSQSGYYNKNLVIQMEPSHVNQTHQQRPGHHP